MKRLIIMAMLMTLGAMANADVPMAFEALDRDANGYISKSESGAREDLEANFATVDKDSDGKLNIKEYQAYQGMGRMTPPEESEEPEPGAAPY